MFYKINEYVYLKKDNYTFKDVLILKDNILLVYCLVAVSGNVTHGLLESLNILSKDKKDQAIKDYLKNKKRLINFEYASAKPFIKLTHYKVGE